MLWVIFWNLGRIYFFFFSMCVTLSAIAINFLQFFQIIFCNLFVSNHIYFQKFQFFILSGCTLICSWYNAIVTAYCKHSLSFSLVGFTVAFYFLCNQKSLYPANIFWSSRRLQHVFSVTILPLPRRLEDVLKTFSRPLPRRLQDVLEDEKMLRWRRLQDISWRRLQDVSETNKMFTGDICT